MDEPQIQNKEAGKTEEAPVEKLQKKSAMEEARELKEQLKSENDRRERIIEREEEMYQRNVLSGRTDAGDLKLTPEEMKKAEAQKVADEITNAFK